MNELGSAIVISAITVSLLIVFLWLGETRTRWKVLALAAFAIPLFLFVKVASPIAFVVGIALQTFLGIALAVYFKAGL
ncbi:MAG TPA: hypothetical protein VFR31_13215 [Thermoanaerobaculia bacterium]|nr:hypothetical protein [Thermoanaerobaculia bacterium]